MSTWCDEWRFGVVGVFVLCLGRLLYLCLCLFCACAVHLKNKSARILAATIDYFFYSFS
jgi:hypothetical protein